MKRVILAVAVATLSIAATSCSGTQSNITKGNKNEFDSLSYALGANTSFGIKAQLADIPLNFNEMIRGFEEAAMKKSSMTQEDAVPILRLYFGETRGLRGKVVREQRNQADSIAIANGATPEEVSAARAQMPADDSMFASKGERDSLSYAFGVDMGYNLASMDYPVQLYWLSKSMDDVLNEAEEPMMNAQQSAVYISDYRDLVIPKLNREASEKWLEKMAKQRGAKVTESGIVYKIIEEGDMSTIATSDEDRVSVIYTGKNRKGVIFDSSRFDDMPEQQQQMLLDSNDGVAKDREASFPLNAVIPGWTEGMKLVGKGGRIHLWIPSDLAYGQRGSGRHIGVNEALFFDVEILDVIPPVVMPSNKTEEQKADEAAAE